MKNGYKKLITDRIKDEVNKWIDELKSKSPDLLLTKPMAALTGFAW